MKNVLQEQSYPTHVESDLYDTFKERYNQKREAVVNFHAFVAFLTIFGAICTPKFRHKIQASRKRVDYLLNRSRESMEKNFLQSYDVLKIVYDTHSRPQFFLNAGG